MFKKIILLTCVCVAISGCWETEKGEKIGSIVKFSKEGAFIATWEAELIRGNLNSGSGAFGRSFHFTVEKPELIEKIKEALDQQKEVKIKYHKEAATLWRCESNNYFLDDIYFMN